ncbi:hypothetical protein [Ornithobacterium rhinotracheale]|uniref:hypothetical protein n=1 Tax=Ornithobacterium rhinotracheale TaxID=28251 RepID=UPI001FF57456|nr:hypothetical protein [Ornithobacterium rhinotracheale]MCK0206230.1 hypothetical protein [Ornithobacterium rhinotracheale]
MERQAKFHTIVYGEATPEVGSQFEKTDCLIICQLEQSGNKVKLLYADGNGKVVEPKEQDVKAYLLSEAFTLSPEESKKWQLKQNGRFYFDSENYIELNVENKSITINSETDGGDNLNANFYVFTKNTPSENTYFNIGIGLDSLSGINTGWYNTAIGYNSLKNFTNGIRNTALGGWTLFSLKKGSDNAAFGASALMEITDGDQNSAFGQRALGKLKIGSFNTGLGINSGASLINGSGNDYIGTNAGFYLPVEDEEENNIMRIGGPGIESDSTGKFMNVHKADYIGVVKNKETKEGFTVFYSHIVINKVKYTMQINDTLTINPHFFKAPSAENQYPYLLTQNEEGEVNRVKNLDFIKEILLSDDFTLSEEEQKTLKQKLGI